MIGRRADGTSPHRLAAGEYGKFKGWWYCAPPPSQKYPEPGLANLSGHSVTEHPDGTITAAPSIRISTRDQVTYHGWLEKGVWREE